MGSRDLSDAADGVLLEQAKEAIKDRILSGKHKFGLYELMDLELNSHSTFRPLLSSLADLLVIDREERKYLADQIVDGLISRYLNDPAQELLIEEEAAAIESEGEDEMDLARIARACGAV